MLQFSRKRIKTRRGTVTKYLQSARAEHRERRVKSAKIEGGAVRLGVVGDGLVAALNGQFILLALAARSATIVVTLESSLRIKSNVRQDEYSFELISVTFAR